MCRWRINKHKLNNVIKIKEVAPQQRKMEIVKKKVSGGVHRVEHERKRNDV